MKELNLSQNKWLRYSAFATLYAAQGIPDAMVLIIFPAYLAANGMTAAAIGTFLATAMLPNSAKLFAGPLIDRVAYLPMGRRRPWVIFGQFGIAISFLFLASIGEPADNLSLFAIGAFCITLATVFQDVATDGMVMDVVPSHEQGRANGIMWGSKTLGTAAAGASGAAILAFGGFEAMAYFAAAILLGVLIFVLVLRERPGERLLPWTAGTTSTETAARQTSSWKILLTQLFAAIRRPAAMRLIGISICIGLIAGLSGALLPVLLVQEFHWNETDYSQFRSSLKLFAGVAGIFAGGVLVDYLGHRRSLVTLFATLMTVNFAMAMALRFQLGGLYLAAFEMLLVFIFIAFFAATMRQCWKMIAATQFSFTMVCGNIALVIGAAMLGPLIEPFGEQGVLFTLAGFAALATMIAGGLKLEDQEAESS